MKCPVCDRENMSMLCPECGFDSSKHYGKYPTLGPVGKEPSVSVLRQDWKKKQSAPEHVEAPAVLHREPEKAPELPRKKKPWLAVAIAACSAILVLGIGIGVGLGGEKPESAEPKETVQMQASPETTAQTISQETSVDPERWRNNILRSDEVRDVNGDGFTGGEEASETSVLGSDYRRSQIRSVIFLDTLADMPEDAWDVSEAGNGTVMAWVKPNENEYDLHIAGDGGVSAGASCSGLFMGYDLARSFDFNGAFHTDGARDMSYMFSGCYFLESLNLSSFDTSNVQDMSNMFSHCAYLKDLNLSSFDTANVQDMSEMFSFCGWFGPLESLDLSSFDTSNVETMYRMFAGSDGLKVLDLSGFDTSNVQDMSEMFAFCNGLKSLDVSSFDTSNVQDMNTMFYWCESLVSLDLRSFDTSNVKRMYNMFSECYSLTELTLSDKFVTTNAEADYMFTDCPAGADYPHLLN